MTSIADAYKNWKETATKVGIGRINYLLSAVTVFTLLMIAVFVASVVFNPGIELGLAIFLIGAYFLSANYYLISWRLKNIGHANPEPAAIIFLLVSAGLGFWSYYATEQNDALTAMMVDAAYLIINTPVGLYLLFMPNAEGKQNFLKKYHMIKEKKNLESERRNLLQEQEIERLKAEVEKLKA